MGAYFHRLRVKKVLSLSADAGALKTAFQSLSSVRDLADVLQCSLQQLNYWRKIAPNSVRYTSFEISKKSGAKRSVDAPHPVLKVLQRKLLQLLESVYEPRAPVQGFVAGRGVLSNASRHARRAWVLNLDLQDFFPTINFGRVRGIFRSKPFNLPDPVAIAIAQLACFQAKLPQGAPTSPLISNVVCAKMDGELRRFAKEHGAMYTRYADDMTFSVRRRGFPQAIATLREPEPGTFSADLSQSLKDIITNNGFAINDAKIRIQPWKRSQRVTGLVVNDRPNLPRRYIRRTRAMLHAWQRYGLEKAEEEFKSKYSEHCLAKKRKPSFKKRLRGQIAYIGHVRGVDDAIYIRFLGKYRVLNGDPTVEVPAAMTDNENVRDVFICHASEDKKDVVEPIVEALTSVGISVWYDKSAISWGDSLAGKINEGLKISRYVMVVMSSAFATKNWPAKEMNAAMSKEIRDGKTTVLPLMVGSDEEIDKVLKSLPMQADKLYLRWTGDAANIAEKLKALLESKR
jgi:RNA-directed DNA polymerase